jgi:hypothetical protein
LKVASSHVCRLQDAGPIAYCAELRSLNLHGCALISSFDFLISLVHLERLVLSRCIPSRGSMRLICANLVQLKKLDLSAFKSFADDSYVTIKTSPFNQLTKLTNLVELNLSEIGLIKCQLDSLSCLQSLTRLDIRGDAVFPYPILSSLSPRLQILRDDMTTIRRKTKGTKAVPLGTYEGEWIEQNRFGVGTMRYNNGNVYSGEWQQQAERTRQDDVCPS